MPKDELAEEESRRWAEIIIEMSLNLDRRPISRANGQRDWPIIAGGARAFGRKVKELDALYDLLLSNLQLAMSVSSDGCPARPPPAAQQHRFRYLTAVATRMRTLTVCRQNVQSIETSTLHLALLGI